jgi:hypothetical protein
VFLLHYASSAESQPSVTPLTLPTGFSSQEFERIMIILSSQITSRIFVYYAILIMLVPYAAAWSLSFFDLIGVDDAFLSVNLIFKKFAPGFMKSILNLIPSDIGEQIMSLALFFYVLPKLFDTIDDFGNNLAKNSKAKKDVGVEKKA